MRRLWVVGLMLIGVLGYASHAGAVPILLNGSLTGPIANNGVPPGWTILLESPDTNDINHNVGGSTPFGIPPIGPSPDGGTWVGLGVDSRVGFNESFGQTIGGFTVGESYLLSWYAGNFGAITGPGYTGPSAIEVLLDGSLIGSGAVLSLGRLWFPESLMFVATSTSHQLAFRLANAEPAYLSIDGIQLTTAVPEPASLLLLGAGLGVIGIGMWRRRK
jgi:hypothetical protein